MKPLIYWKWLIAYKIVVKLEKYAYKYHIYDQVNKCIDIENNLMFYKSLMRDKGLW